MGLGVYLPQRNARQTLSEQARLRVCQEDLKWFKKILTGVNLKNIYLEINIFA